MELHCSFPLCPFRKGRTKLYRFDRNHSIWNISNGLLGMYLLDGWTDWHEYLCVEFVSYNYLLFVVFVVPLWNDCVAVVRRLTLNVTNVGSIPTWQIELFSFPRSGFWVTLFNMQCLENWTEDVYLNSALWKSNLHLCNELAFVPLHNDWPLNIQSVFVSTTLNETQF